MAEVDLQAAQQRYSWGAILLHWGIALALAFQLALGFSMPKDERGFALFQLHKSVGITILLLSLARLAWRLTHRPPPAVEGGFQGFLAKAVHTLLYAFMIGMPLTGWAVVSTSPIQVPTLFWGAIPWPHLPLPGSLNESAEATHEILAWIGISLILLHVAGALRHQLLLKDGLLRRMGPGGSAWAAGLLALAVVAVYFGTGMKIAGDVVAAGGYNAVQEQAPETARVPLEAEPTASPTPEAEETETAEEEEAVGPPPVWTIQSGGRLGFTVTSGSDSYRGSFSDWNGAIRFDPDNPETADIRITVRLASATVGDATMDATMQDAEFFASAANPTATWRSTSVRRTGPGRYSASGTLSLKGASRPQSLDFTLAGEGLRRHVEGSASIDRTAFSIGTGETGAGLGNAVALNFAFDAVGRAP
jgi:cytochrome b561/polyisoprenoid-binding protein YceI